MTEPFRAQASGAAASRLDRLSAFLDRDPDNLALIADCAGAALDAGATDTALHLIEEYARRASLPPGLVNMRGLIALGEARFADAAADFEAVLGTQDVGESGVRFNLAWAKAMLREHDAALALLDDVVIAAVPAAAPLKIKMMHHLGLFEEALGCGRDMVERYPDDAGLRGGLAVLALDAGDAELARHYAQGAERSDDGLAADGLLLLDEQRIDDALARFDAAIALRPGNARAWLGRGLGLLVQGDNAAAIAAIDEGASLFGDHIGSWIASGWAHFLKGDLGTSRARFERALALDDSFAESHGGLAVVDIAEGLLDSARLRTKIALRLDRSCFAAALARSMLASGEGDADTARRITAAALNSPIDGSSRTIAGELAALGGIRRGGTARR